MALSSNLFRDDRKLLAASLSDTDHILQGQTGPHVRKIQSALTIIDHAVIASAETGNEFFGRSTASAVLVYKTKRKIVNRSYQTQADNIVGKMTIASLDREMLVREAQTRPSCNCGPAPQRPLLAFTVPARFVAAPAPGVSPPSPPPPPAQLFLVQKSRPGAAQLAQTTADVLEAVANGSMQPANDAALATAALKTHYLCTDAELVQTARKVRDNLKAIVSVLSRDVFAPGVPGDPNGAGAYAYLRGPRDGKIYVNPSFTQLAKFGRELVLVHEGFHFLSANNQDFCRNPDADGAKSYRAVPKELRLKHAYSLSQLVLHIRFKAEKTLDEEKDTIADPVP